MPTPAQAADRMIPDALTNLYHVNGCYLASPTDHAAALKDAAEAAGRDEARLRGWMSRRGRWPAAGAGGAAGGGGDAERHEHAA